MLTAMMLMVLMVRRGLNEKIVEKHLIVRYSHGVRKSNWKSYTINVTL